MLKKMFWKHITSIFFLILTNVFNVFYKLTSQIQILIPKSYNFRLLDCNINVDIFVWFPLYAQHGINDCFYLDTKSSVQIPKTYVLITKRFISTAAQPTECVRIPKFSNIVQ